MVESTLYRQNIVACVWDFDKTLIKGYMESPIFRYFGVDEKSFWNEVNALPDTYRKQGQRVSSDILYLNHLLTYVRNGLMKGLNNELLFKLGAKLDFYPGIPEFLHELKELVHCKEEYVKHHIKLEHFIVSTGLGEMIRGSKIAPVVDGIYGCEYIENALQPGFLNQSEFHLPAAREISQIGQVVDNTTKTRFVFEIKKGCNKNPEIDVNSKIKPDDQRVPIPNMIYIADGPSDVPVFSVVKKFGGRSFAVYDGDSAAAFAQNDKLLQVGRIHAYGPANYTSLSSTYMWIKMHVLQICDRIVRDRDHLMAMRVVQPPKHIHEDDNPAAMPIPPKQELLFEK